MQPRRRKAQHSLQFLLLLLPWIILTLERCFRAHYVDLTSLQAPAKAALKAFKYSSSRRRAQLRSLVGFRTRECQDDLIQFESTIRSGLEQTTVKSVRLVPAIFHQSLSQCMAPAYHDLATKWSRALPGDWSHLIHDQAAMTWLLTSRYEEFPQLGNALACATNPAIQADLWRYLVLYEYGGVYADIDSAPKGFNVSMVRDEQSLFLVNKYNMISCHFFASAPRHPMLFYTIHHAIQRIQKELDTGKVHPGRTTGSHALLAGFHSFMADVGVRVGAAADKPIQPGVYHGRDNWAVTVAGDAADQDGLVMLVAVESKLQAYAQVGMSSHPDEMVPSNQTCLKQMLSGRGSKVGALSDGIDGVVSVSTT